MLQGRKSLWLSLIWAINCTRPIACAPPAAKYESAAEKVVTGREMKALTGIAFVVAATFTDLTITEPAMLLLSGGLLLGLADAVRRIPGLTKSRTCCVLRPEGLRDPEKHPA